MRGEFARRLSASGLLLVATLGLAGCNLREARLDGADGLTTASTGTGSLKAVAEAGRRWEADPANAELGLAYAGRLEALGESDRQLQVLQVLSQKNPGDVRILSTYGKELARAGRQAEAAAVLQQAVATGKADWKAHSTLGSAYDQQARHHDARRHYERALELKPDEITVLNNMGMSFALEGNLPMAEATLRRAYALPAGQGNPRLRQNLALVVGLSGRYDEARRIASQDLPPDEVEANMAYLQKMMAQPDTWQQLRGETAS